MFFCVFEKVSRFGSFYDLNFDTKAPPYLTMTTTQLCHKTMLQRVQDLFPCADLCELMHWWDGKWESSDRSLGWQLYLCHDYKLATVPVSWFVLRFWVGQFQRKRRCELCKVQVKLRKHGGIWWRVSRRPLTKAILLVLGQWPVCHLVKLVFTTYFPWTPTLTSARSRQRQKPHSYRCKDKPYLEF